MLGLPEWRTKDATEPYRGPGFGGGTPWTRRWPPRRGGEARRFDGAPARIRLRVETYSAVHRRAEREVELRQRTLDGLTEQSAIIAARKRFDLGRAESFVRAQQRMPQVVDGQRGQVTPSSSMPRRLGWRAMEPRRRRCIPGRRDSSTSSSAAVFARLRWRATLRGPDDEGVSAPGDEVENTEVMQATGGEGRRRRQGRR